MFLQKTVFHTVFLAQYLQRYCTKGVAHKDSLEFHIKTPIRNCLGMRQRYSSTTTQPRQGVNDQKSLSYKVTPAHNDAHQPLPRVLQL